MHYLTLTARIAPLVLLGILCATAGAAPDAEAVAGSDRGVIRVAPGRVEFAMGPNGLWKFFGWRGERSSSTRGGWSSTRTTRTENRGTCQRRQGRDACDARRRRHRAGQRGHARRGPSSLDPADDDGDGQVDEDPLDRADNDGDVRSTRTSRPSATKWSWPCTARAATRRSWSPGVLRVVAVAHRRRGGEHGHRKERRQPARARRAYRGPTRRLVESGVRSGAAH